MADRNASKSVMGNLSSTRPARMNRRRQTADATATKPAPKTAAKPKAAKPKPAPKATPKATTPKATKPRAVRSGSPALKAAKEKSAPRKPEPASPPRGTELVTTAVQAAGELAQIGLTLGGQAVKRAVRRLPKP
jgi:hypothetical protein